MRSNFTGIKTAADDKNHRQPKDGPRLRRNADDSCDRERSIKVRLIQFFSSAHLSDSLSKTSPAGEVDLPDSQTVRFTS
jgi:hypothetical protein